MLIQKTYRALGLMLILLLVGSCSDVENITAINIFPVSKDIQLGKDLDVQIKADSKEYPILKNATATKYVQDMIDEIIKSSEIEYKDDFAYTVTLINRDDVINAFAAPGGYIYVYTGLLKFLDNEATLAGVLAHEVAHAERRHATKRLTKAYGVDFLLGLVLGTDPNATAEIAAGILTNVAFMQNSQADEFEADEYAFKYLQTSKWYPGGIKLFFNKINENGGSSSNFLEKLLSTHPMPEERIQKVDEMIKESNLPPASESNIFTDKYQQFKKSL